MKGNVVDMAVGIIIGAAFGKIIASMVSDVLMPPLGLLIGGVNFTELKFIMKSAIGENPAVTLNYGNFFQAVFDFLIVAFVVFMMIKAMNATRKKQVPPPPPLPEPTKEEILLTEIRDLLKK